MHSSHRTADPIVFKPRSGRWFMVVAVVVTLGGLASAAASEGPSGLLTGWPLLWVAYLGWWLFWHPAVVLTTDAVVLRNPLSTVHVPWSALIHVDTKYALKLVTASGSYTAWAAPAPGVWGTHAGKPEHVTNLPSTSYGAGGSVRPGDLKNTDSGHAAYLVRTRWQDLVETGAVDVDMPGRASRRINVVQLAIGTVLLAGTVTTLAGAS